MPSTDESKIEEAPEARLDIGVENEARCTDHDVDTATKQGTLCGHHQRPPDDTSNHHAAATSSTVTQDRPNLWLVDTAFHVARDIESE